MSLELRREVWCFWQVEREGGDDSLWRVCNTARKGREPSTEPQETLTLMKELT